jgi:hypothetical protein
MSWWPLAALAAGIVYLALASRLPVGSLSKPEAGMFPVFVAILILLAASVCAVVEWRSWRSSGPAGPDRPAGLGSRTATPWPGRERRDEWRASVVAGWRLPGFVVAMLAYVLLAESLGHVVTASAVATALIHMGGRRRWWSSLLWGILIGVVSMVLFETVLGMALPGPGLPLPRGLL